MTVDAIQFDGSLDAAYEISRWSDTDIGFHKIGTNMYTLAIRTNRGVIAAIAGDWIIRSAHGLSSCSHSEFEAGYEPSD